MISKRKCDNIYDIAQKYEIPYELLWGIVTLEMTYRKWYHRFAENTCVILLGTFSVLFGYRIRNYTIGYCQVGVATILSYSGILCYRHAKVVKLIKFSYINYLMRRMSFTGSVDICAKMLHDMYFTEVMRTNSMSKVYRNIGQHYNGTLTYGLLLENFCK